MGVTAVAVLIIALIQVVVGVVLLRISKEAVEAIKDLRNEVKPLIQKATKVADDAGRVSALALTQVERVDHLMSSTALRIDDTLQLVQSSVLAPVRQGTAVLAGLKAAMAVFRARQDKGRYGRDDEDALFIG